MRRTPFQLRRMYRAGLLEINQDAPLSAPAECGSARALAWSRVLRRALRYLQTETNSEQMAKTMKGVNRNTVTPQAIRQDLTKGFAALLERGYLREPGSSGRKSSPNGLSPDHNSRRPS